MGPDITPVTTGSRMQADESDPIARHPCRAVAPVLARVGDKWSVLIVRALGQEPRRFNALKRDIDGISQRMLSLTLRGLERDGLVTRTVFATVPPRVDYALTDLGRSLWTPVEALGAWAQRHYPEIEAAQRRYDGEETEAAAHPPRTLRQA